MFPNKKAEELDIAERLLNQTCKKLCQSNWWWKVTTLRWPKKKEKANACGSVEWTVEGRGKDQVTHRASASGRSIIQSRPITINRMEGRKPEPEEKFVLVHPFWIC